MDKLIDAIKESEGFRSKVYKCTEGYDTIGYGFAIKDLELDEDICHQILVKKIEALKKKALNKFPFMSKVPEEKCNIIYEMCFQMGVSGVSKFKKMLLALENGNYDKASAEMLDSLWAKQTPNRALKLSNEMKSSV
tara:strand:+ start:3172 stop:3579 length:408 start_codon:yes stop_codon:yes gene_type:complete